MDSQAPKNHTLEEQAIPVAQMFQSHTTNPLHETIGSDCHAFEIYDARNAKVRETAYLRAQARGFEAGHDLDDWLAAEHEVDAAVFAEIAPVGFVG